LVVIIIIPSADERSKGMGQDLGLWALVKESFTGERAMIRLKGRYRNQVVELEQPLQLADGTEVEIEIRLPGQEVEAEEEGWSALGMSRLEEEWDNPKDAIYDDWKRLYGV
jgi:hypothetical protein